MQLPDVFSSFGFWEMLGTWVIALTIFIEARAIRRQHATESFWVIVGRRQEGEVRKARRVLLRAHKEGKLNNDPVDWTEDVVDAAELTASRFDEIGILLEAKALDEGLLLPSWSKAIVRCYEALLPWIEHQRITLDDPERWRNFEILAHRAGKISVRTSFMAGLRTPAPARVAVPVVTLR
ncbi:MAG: hypothetical protein IPK82_29490 [Polyangiaceae bacterium]|nr:hypothetical protein [Polyangiaceae bacterium]